jgi:phage gp16-like protein
MSGLVNLRGGLIQKIHIAKNELGMSDESYRALLVNEAGYDSCKLLNDTQLRSVLERMKKIGFKVKPKSKVSPQSRNKPKHQKTQIDLLRALWISMAKEGIVNDRSEAGLNAWVKRATVRINGGEGIDSVEWLANDTILANRVLESLKQWRLRVQRDRAMKKGT